MDAEVRKAVFSEALRTARTKAERARVINAFMGRAERTSADREFSEWLAVRSGRATENVMQTRAMGEGTLSGGGDLVPVRFYRDVIRQAREYDGFVNAFELFESKHGDAMNRPVAAFFDPASKPSENGQITEGPYPTLSQQAWGQAKTYGARFIASNQLIQDAFRNTLPSAGWSATPVQGIDAGHPVGVGTSAAPYVSPTPDAQLDALISSGLGESLGRAMAPDAQALVYATVGAAAVTDSGGYVQLGTATPVTFSVGAATTELAANTISLDTAGQMLAALDEAYLPSSAWYFSREQWSAFIRQADANKHLQYQPSSGRMSLYNLPVVLTSQVTDLTASTVSGPVLGDLRAAFTQRIVMDPTGIYFMRSIETYAEYLRTLYRMAIRGDFAVRDSRAVVGVQAAAS